MTDASMPPDVGSLADFVRANAELANIVCDLQADNAALAARCGELERGNARLLQAIATIDLEDAQKIARLTLAAETQQVTIDTLRDVIEDALEFVDGQVDVVDGDYGVPAPNRAMILFGTLREALAATKPHRALASQAEGEK